MESLISSFFYCVALGSLMTLVSALYWHMHVLFLLILEKYEIHLGPVPFFNWGRWMNCREIPTSTTPVVTVSNFQVRNLHPLCFWLAEVLSLPICCFRDPCICGSCTHTQVGACWKSFPYFGRKYFTHCHLFGQGKNNFQVKCYLKEVTTPHRTTPPSLIRLYSVVTACDTFSNGPPSGCSCD